MIPRRKSREEAVKVLYQLKLNPKGSTAQALLQLKEHFEGTPDPFTERLVQGVAEHLSELDGFISQVSQKWRVDRIAAIDLTILRIGAFELLYCDDIPSTVTIDEMIELAKVFAAEESSAFVNGMLDEIRKKYPRPGKAP